MRQLKISKSITNRSSESLDKYLVEIGRVPMISIEEEIELAQKIRKGGRAGERAKEKLVNAKSDLSILHPLPRVNEISVAVDKDPRAAYWRQVKNGKFIRMALIMKLLGIEV